MRLQERIESISLDIPMPRSALPVEPGATFYNGKLRIEKGAEAMHISACPVPHAVRRRGAGSTWESFQPEFRLVHPYHPRRPARAKTENTKDQLAFEFFDDTFESRPLAKLSPSQKRKRAFDQFRFSLPKPTAKFVEPFLTHQWPLIFLLHYDRGSIELAQNNPALAFLLAQKMNCDAELIQTLLCSRMRQRDLLSVLDLPSSPAAVNLFRKLAPQSVNGDNWPSILQLLRQELAAPKTCLNHLSRINTGVIEILLEPQASRAVTPSLLGEVARDPAQNYRARTVHAITSTLRMQEELHEPRRTARFQNLARLREVHDEVSESYRRRIRQLIEANLHQTDRFQSPPLPGIPGKIEPITSAAELFNEGEAQGNCVASYANRVHSGSTFIYRVLHPQRATLSVVRGNGFDIWEIGELEARFNTDVTDETEDFVQAWLDRHRAVM